jgi:hypothetical protein
VELYFRGEKMAKVLNILKILVGLVTELNICNWHENIQSFGWRREQWDFQNNEKTMEHSEF